MITISKKEQHNEDKLRDACRIFLWERWLLTFSSRSLGENYTTFNTYWSAVRSKNIVEYRVSGFIRILFGYSEEELLKNRENYYCGIPTVFSEYIESKFGYPKKTTEITGGCCKSIVCTEII